MTGDRPLEYRVVARNTSASSENKIHDDTVAKRYGFGGGLVPGITVYAYLTRPLVEAFGRDWLERGTAAVRFVKPIFEGDDVLVTARVTGREGEGIALALSATTPNGGECAVGTATLPDRAPTAVDPARYPEAALPDDRPDVSREHLASVGVLGSPVVRYDTEAAADYIDKVSDDLPAYRGGAAPAHPGFLLQQCNRALSGNVRLGPWIHTGSRVQHLGGARVGDVLSTRGRVHGFSEKKGRESVELDLLIVANGSRPVAQVFHSAIYRLPAPAEA